MARLKRTKLTGLIDKIAQLLGRVPSRDEVVKCGKVVSTGHGWGEYQWNNQPLFRVVVE